MTSVATTAGSGNRISSTERAHIGDDKSDGAARGKEPRGVSATFPELESSSRPVRATFRIGSASQRGLLAHSGRNETDREFQAACRRDG